MRFPCFEGEETLAALLGQLETIRSAESAADRFSILREIPNLLVSDGDKKLAVGPRVTLDLRDVPPPDYSDVDLDRYLAPSRTLLYAPTRGCYWNQCSFCYYGLSATATASYCEIPARESGPGPRGAVEAVRVSRISTSRVTFSPPVTPYS